MLISRSGLLRRMIVSGLIVLRRVAILRVRLNTKNVKNNRF